MSDDGVRVVDDRLVQYVNGFDVGISAVEILLTLKHTTGGESYPQFDFVSTPEVAKALYIILGRAITEYELNFGRIRDIPKAETKVGQIWPTTAVGVQ